MARSLLLAILVASMAFAPQAAGQDLPSPAVRALLEQDLRLARIAGPMLVRNQAICRQSMPQQGFVLHSRDQYSEIELGDSFVAGPVAIAAVIPGSHAARAGIAPGDAIIAVDGIEIAALPKVEDSPVRDAVFEAMAALPAEAPLRLTVAGADGVRSLVLDPAPACRALVEIRAASALGARSDGRVIQVNYGFAQRANDEELAVVFAHELAHLVLEHRRRLSSAGVEKGFFGEVGRNQQLNRQVEVEADRLSVHLLANAGYDPSIAPAFWRSSLGKRAGGGMIGRSATYPSPESRARLVEREISEYLAGGAPSYPGHLLVRRDLPFE